MMSTVSTAGLSVLVLALASRQAMAVDVGNCVDLLNSVGSSDTTLMLTMDVSCSGGPITIDSRADVTILGEGNSIEIGAGFSGDSLFDNSGTLTLDNVTISETQASGLETGVRAIDNKGTLTVTSCTFRGLNQNSGSALEKGGAIYSNSAGEVTISGSYFTSNVATERGGGICAEGTETLTIENSAFKNNEAGAEPVGTAVGGDVYAINGVTLTLTSTNFTESSAEYGGAAVECCGATITDCLFSGTESNLEAEHYGALLVGRPNTGGCKHILEMSTTNFTGCTVDFTTGSGGSLAVFDTEAKIENCEFVGSEGTAVLFESSSTTGAHQLTLTSSLFNWNTNPSEEFAASDTPQGGALVLKNTGSVESDETVIMGDFFNVFCFANDPYECEFVYDTSYVLHDGEMKCQICNEDGDRQLSGTDDDLTTGAASSRSSDDNEGIVIGLSLALGLTLVVIGALAVWKFRVRKNARRLMEDMGDGDL